MKQSRLAYLSGRAGQTFFQEGQIDNVKVTEGQE